MIPTRVLLTVAVAVLTALLCAATAANTGYTDTLLDDIDGLVVAGGFYQGQQYERYVLNNVEVLDMESLPWLPAQVYQNTLTAVGPMLYSCGGDNQTVARTSDCYTLDTKEVERVWTQDVTLPVPMRGQTAVAVSSHIWFTFEDVIYDFDSLTGLFQHYDAPYSVSAYHCAVSNDTHSFVIGVGSERKEIWRNVRDYSPADWEMVYVMSEPIERFGCLWHQNEIFITGGKESESKAHIFDISSSEMRSTGKLAVPRQTHRMAVFEGKPAVFGGYNTDTIKQLSSIETYDSSTDTWAEDSRFLSQARSWFGLAHPTY